MNFPDSSVGWLIGWNGFDCFYTKFHTQKTHTIIHPQFIVRMLLLVGISLPLLRSTTTTTTSSSSSSSSRLIHSTRKNYHWNPLHRMFVWFLLLLMTFDFENQRWKVLAETNINFRRRIWTPIQVSSYPSRLKFQNNNNYSSKREKDQSLNHDDSQHHYDHHHLKWKQIAFRGGSIISGWNHVTDYIGATRRRCWIVLGVAIVIEIASTTLLNIASQEKSTQKMALAMLMYMTRYVH
jgi:hypothetical protein